MLTPTAVVKCRDSARDAIERPVLAVWLVDAGCIGLHGFRRGTSGSRRADRAGAAPRLVPGVVSISCGPDL